MRRVLRGILTLLAAVAALATLAPGAAAQGQARVSTVEPSDTVYEVRLGDGSTYVGRVVAAQGDSLTLQTTAGARVTLPRAAVTAMRPAEGRLVNGAYWYRDPNDSRLFFSPTGRTLPKGSGYFGVYELFIPFVAYGVTDRLLIAGGSPFYLGLLGEDITPPVYFGPKLQVVSRPGASASVGALAVYVPDDGDGGEDDIFGIAYGVGTFGSPDQSLSVGLGWGYQGSDFTARPLVMVGGETRMSRSLKLVTENLFVPGEDGVILSGGVRLFGERLSADAGLGGFVDSDEVTCCLPMVNFVYHLGSH
jgi:hypothetical protein